MSLAMISFEAPAPVLAPTPSPTPSPIVIGPDARWLLLSNGARVEMGRRGPPRRILLALAEARVRRPNTALTAADLVEAGWPGERMRHASALMRLYTTVRRLRRLGLADVLVTREDGYLLAPQVALLMPQRAPVQASAHA
ncbi:MAG: hypothetical protein KC657_36130 [Myxococcales bacterium]|nr:hypothetical protein [Myxococcales bacterium]